MTAHLRLVTSADVARLAAQDEALDAARAILRSKAPHTRATIRDACHVVMTFGDAWDWMDGYHILQAMRAPVAPPPMSPQPRLIRAALVDCAGLAVIAGIALAVYFQ